MGKSTLLLSLVSGILLFLSFPKFDFNFLIWVSLIPLLIALQGKRGKESFRIGFVTGLIGNVGIIYWVVFVVVRYGYLPFYVGIFVMLLLAAYLSIYVALFAMGVVFFRRRGIREIIAAPLLWTCLEYGKSHLLTGFPWENLAYALYKNVTLIQIADITGIYGLGFLIVFVNCVLYEIVTMKSHTKKHALGGVVGGLVLCSVVYGYGVYRIDSVEKLQRDATPRAVTIIQGNVDQSIKWDSEYQNETLRIYKDLSLTESESPPSLIVWPETAAPFFFQNIDDNHRSVIDVARKSRSYLLFGSPSFSEREGRRVFLNSAYLVSPVGEIVGRYDKVHLVPYGEYVPLRDIFFFLEKLVVGVGDFVPGEEVSPLQLGEEKAGVLICYEGIFPEISRHYRQQGTSLLISITNDAWFGTSSAPYQHVTMTAFRAVENRLYIIRAANTGISAIIEPSGKIASRTGLFERTALAGEMKFIKCDTFYSKYGNIFVYLCIITLLGVGIISLKRREVNDR